MDNLPANADTSIISEDVTLDYSWKVFDHLTIQIQNADTKASLIMGVDAILFGTLAKLVAERVTTLPDHLYAIPDVLSVILLGMALILLGVSVYSALIVTRPMISRTKDSGLFYFAMIRTYSRDEFIKNFENRTYEQVHRDLLSQVHVLADITQRKYQRTATSLSMLLACLSLWGMAELIKVLG